MAHESQQEKLVMPAEATFERGHKGRIHMGDEKIGLDLFPDQTSRKLKRVRTNACGSDSLFFEKKNSSG